MSDKEDGLLSAVGFMFDTECLKVSSSIELTAKVTVTLQLIDGSPGHLQSGKVLALYI